METESLSQKESIYYSLILNILLIYRKITQIKSKI